MNKTEFFNWLAGYLAASPDTVNKQPIEEVMKTVTDYPVNPVHKPVYRDITASISGTS